MKHAPVIPVLFGLSMALVGGCGSDDQGGSTPVAVAVSPVAGPMTVLHLGDSHTAADHFSGHLRSLFQKRFGRGSRGMLPPGAIYSGYSPHQVDLHSRGEWVLFDAWRNPDDGPYGLSGYRLVSAEPGARLTYQMADGEAITQVRLGIYGGPQAGGLILSVEGGDSHMIRTRSAMRGYTLKSVRLDRPARRITLSPVGDGPVTLLSVGLRQPGAAGVTYVSHGVPGATIALLARMDETILKQEFAALDPSLIILAFGTNEGFDDALDGATYRRLFAAQVRRVEALAPSVRIVIAGPPDANRLTGTVRERRSGTRPGACVAEPPNTAAVATVQSYWSVPGKLRTVREIQRKVAEARGLVFWDWSTVMGGPCGMHDWVNSVPPRAFTDHVHMTDEGAAESARQFFDALTASRGQGPEQRPAAGADP